MSNWYSKKRAAIKRITAFILAAVMLLSVFPADTDVYAATPRSAETDYGTNVRRGVVEDITDLPQYGEGNIYADNERGTEKRPFTILEIVGYYEQAEIGYMIGGCEPIRMEELFGSPFLKELFAHSGADTSLNTADVYLTDSTDKVYFFTDEKECDVRYYSQLTNEEWAGRKVTTEETVNGYWEYVGDTTGQGLFAPNESRLGTHKRVADGSVVKMEASSTDGDFRWHTVNQIERENNAAAYSKISFNDVVDISKTYKLGERVYTTRKNDENSTLYNMAGDDLYAYYKNKEIFLTETLGLTEKEAAAYSVVVKTITPEDLNDNPEWIDYADLIYINPVSKNTRENNGSDTSANLIGYRSEGGWIYQHSGDVTGSEYFGTNGKVSETARMFKYAYVSHGNTKLVNRLGLDGADFSNRYYTNIFETNDLDFSVVRRIFYKVSAEENFATLMMDSDLYQLNSLYYSNVSKKSVLFDVFDWNLDQVINTLGSPEPALLSAQTEVLETTLELPVYLAGTTKYCYFTKNGAESDFCTVKGKTTNANGSITYNGTTYDYCLKMESSTSISFTAESDGTLTLVFGGGTKAGKKVMVDGTEHSIGDGQVTVELSAGSHTITKKDTDVFLYYISYTANEAVATASPAPTAKPTATPAPAATAVPEGGMTHNFTENGKKSSFYTITGSLATNKGSTTYNGLTLTQCLKMESSTAITFPTENAGTLTLVFGGTTSASGKTVKLDGTEYTIGSDGTVKISVSAGSHKITKGDSINLFYMSFAYDAVATATPAPTLAPTYTVTWLDGDGTVLRQDTGVAYGTVPSYDGDTPTQKATAQFTYEWLGTWATEVSSGKWEETALEAVTGDITYKARFRATARSYTITFVDSDGTVLNATTWPYGSTPSCKSPKKEPTTEYIYTFAGWEPAMEKVTKEATYKATYTQTPRVHTVTWKNEDGTVLETDTDVPYLSIPSYDGKTPTKEKTAQYTYTFKGWSPEVSAVTGDVIYVATYSATVNKYTITWKNGDIVLKTDTLEYGAEPSYKGGTPVKEATSEYTYTFSGWSPAISSVKGNATYTATFDAILIGTQTATPAPAATAVPGSGMVHNFTDNGKNSSFYSITGNLSTTKGSTSYNGLTLTQCLKMESSTNISFTAPGKGTFVMVFDDSESNKKIVIDGKSYTTGTNGILTVSLAAGSHKVTKGDSINLFYMSFAPDDASVTIAPATAAPTAAPTAKPTQAPTISASGDMVHNFTVHGTSSKYYTFGTTMNWDSKASKKEYGGLTLTKAIKLENATEISFTAKKGGTLTLVTTKVNKKIDVDGTEYTTDDDGVAKIYLTAGKHQISRNESLSIYYMSFEYGDVPANVPTPTPSAAPGVSTPTPGEVVNPDASDRIHNFTKNTLNSDFYSFTGEMSTKYQVTYNYDDTELLLKQALKMNSSASIKFTAESDGTLTMVFNDGCLGKSILVNGKSYDINDNTVVVPVSAGTEYTIKRVSGNETFIFFLAVEYGNGSSGSGGVITPTEPVVSPMPDALQISSDASKNNIYKLTLMLTSIKPNLVKQIWFKNGYITSKGINLLQTSGSEAAEYWSGITFKLARTNMNNIAADSTYYGYAQALSKFDLYDDWNGPEGFINFGWHEKYGLINNGIMVEAYVCDHVFGYVDKGSGLVRYFTNPNSVADAPEQFFVEFDEYLKKEFSGKAEALQASKTTKPAYALRYVFDLNASSVTATSVLNVLDIEPSVSINDQLQQQWKLQNSYVQMLVPDFAGTIKITHQTTAEFNAKSENINSMYDLIYIGTDYSGYNTKSDVIKIYETIPNTSINTEITDFNDSAMDGMIYFHLGDMLTSTEYKDKDKNRDRSVQFLVDESGNSVGGTVLRFSGNDISDLKLDELVSYVYSGRPVVADKLLYDYVSTYVDGSISSKLVDPTSNIFEFVQKYHKEDALAGTIKGVYSLDEIFQVNERVRDNDVLIIYNECPPLYDGSTVSDTSAELADATYLPVSAKTGRAYMYFDFTVFGKNYGYRIFVDQDKNGKFEDDELIVSGNVQNGKSTSYTYPLALEMVGLVQWKLEIYSKANENINQVLTGCSAIAKKPSADKEQINVLQILPKNNGDTKDGFLDLEDNALFKKYITGLENYEVTIKSVTLDEFQALFAGENFDFDMSKDIIISNDGGNPKADTLNTIEAKKIGGKSLKSYNMLIIGFMDTYGEKNLDNSNGAVEYLQYYALSGKSILFTHDLTSLYNVDAEGGAQVFGSTANTLLRDLMGMNRYKALSNQIEDRNPGGLAEMVAYQNKTTYDDVASVYRHGFTYWAMKRFGWIGDYTKDCDDYEDEKMPFAAMIQVPGASDPVTKVDTSSEKNASKKAWYEHFADSGFNNSNELTTVVKQMNTGQITEYPYKIDETLKVAKTHAQTYQLNLEDPEVTVWYCLSGVEGGATSTSKADGGNGTSVSYAANPMDGANNYYIYSKGNIFYSGVGHSQITDDAEAKLFVNTMIAAFRNVNEAAAVQILNPGVIEESDTKYTLQVPREFNNSGVTDDADNQYTVENFAGQTVEVIFTPINYNFRNVMDCRIKYLNGSYITDIYYYDENGVKQEMHVSSGEYFKNLRLGEEYYLLYPKENLDNGLRTIEFEVTYSDAPATGKTKLNMTIQPLFQLD